MFVPFPDKVELVLKVSMPTMSDTVHEINSRSTCFGAL